MLAKMGQQRSQLTFRSSSSVCWSTPLSSKSTREASQTSWMTRSKTMPCASVSDKSHCSSSHNGGKRPAWKERQGMRTSHEEQARQGRSRSTHHLLVRHGDQGTVRCTPRRYKKDEKMNQTLSRGVWRLCVPVGAHACWGRWRIGTEHPPDLHQPLEAQTVVDIENSLWSFPFYAIDTYSF